MYNYCVHRGETNVNLSRVKLGKQKCKWCGTEIVVKMTSPTYALFPRHKRPDREKT